MDWIHIQMGWALILFGVASLGAGFFIDSAVQSEGYWFLKKIVPAMLYGAGISLLVVGIVVLQR